MKLHGKLDDYCQNKDLLGLLFSKVVKVKDQNLLKRDLLRVFENITYLYIEGWLYSFDLLSFLSVIHGTKINKIEVYGHYWMPKVAAYLSFDSIRSKYKQANYKLEYERQYLIITKNTN